MVVRLRPNSRARGRRAQRWACRTLISMWVTPDCKGPSSPVDGIRHHQRGREGFPVDHVFQGTVLPPHLATFRDQLWLLFMIPNKLGGGDGAHCPQPLAVVGSNDAS